MVIPGSSRPSDPFASLMGRPKKMTKHLKYALYWILESGLPEREGMSSEKRFLLVRMFIRVQRGRVRVWLCTELGK